jgi:hypothetical protein
LQAVSAVLLPILPPKVITQSCVKGFGLLEKKETVPLGSGEPAISPRTCAMMKAEPFPEGVGFSVLLTVTTGLTANASVEDRVVSKTNTHCHHETRCLCGMWLALRCCEKFMCLLHSFEKPSREETCVWLLGRTRNFFEIGHGKLKISRTEARRSSSPYRDPRLAAWEGVARFQYCSLNG